MSSSSIPEPQVRISRIAGRYLVFDIKHVMHLRRQHGICGVLTGTMPQNPTQNLFLSLPIELYAEEAKLLVDKKAAYVVDNAAAHLSELKAMDDASRKAYLQSLKTQRSNAQALLARDRAAVSDANRRRYRSSQQSKSSESPGVDDADDSLFSSEPSATVIPVTQPNSIVAITPGTSHSLVDTTVHNVDIEEPKAYPLYSHLNSRGYFFTPGLRFGGDYSVYPGDPFRYHAHFLAKNYGWDEEISMIDIVASGRLGTAVKKSFLMGGHEPPTNDGERQSHEDKQDGGAGRVRTFCIEWGGM